MSLPSPLAQPIHLDRAGPDDPPWRDNAYLAFWSSHSPVCGEMHISTSPNAEGRRVRLEVVVDHETIELIEPLDPGTFESPSMRFGLDGVIEAKHERLEARIEYRTRFNVCNYGPSGVLGGLVQGVPLHHYQQGVDVHGVLKVHGRTIEFRGQGFRDRTWGFRDETAQWEQYAALWACFDSFDFTALKILGTDGKIRSAGFLLDESGHHVIESSRITWDPSGLMSKVVLVIDGQEREVNITERVTNGVWQPLGPQKEGPQLSTYVEFPLLDAWGHAGRGLSGTGAIRRIW